MAIDLDLDVIERSVGKLFRRHPIVREQPQVSLAWMPPELLDFFLDARQKAVALVREEHSALGDADVAPDEIAGAQERDDLDRIVRMLERAREQIAEARGHGHIGHGQPDSGRRRGAHGRVAADCDQIRKIGAARLRPPDEVVQCSKGLHPRREALLRELLSHGSGDGHGTSIARAGRHDDLNRRRHRIRRSGAGKPRARRSPAAQVANVDVLRDDRVR